jgi:uncharacterized protein involved in exopolysaccharide biosynthesis
MESRDIVVYDPVRRIPASPREVLQILFRHRRLILVSFFAVLAGAVITIALFGIKYRAHTTILVRSDRSDEMISAGREQPHPPGSDLTRKRQINTEVALLKSRDLLEKVVRQSNLFLHSHHSWGRRLEVWDTSNSGMAKAVRALRAKLTVAPIPDSNLIGVSYTSRNPEQAVTILRNLDKYYIAKHIAVNRPPDVVHFFAQQTKHYQGKLVDAEKRLARFDVAKDAAAPDLERKIVLKKRSEFEAGLRSAQVQIAQTQQLDRALEAELSDTPPRLSTQQTLSENGQLLADLKSTLQNLEDQRTVLLANYQPTYRPVRNVEKQIAQVKAAITKAESRPLERKTTDRNPTYEMLQSELAKSRASLFGLRQRVAAIAPVVQTYEKAALVSDVQDIQRKNLVRSVTVDQQNYLLYLKKLEQARISQALDKQQILNVAVAEAPTVPALPTTSPILLLAASIILAGILSVGVAFLADYFDSTFRTPDEVARYLELPVLAALPMTGGPARFALQADGDSYPFVSSESGHGRSRLLFWRQRNGD